MSIHSSLKRNTWDTQRSVRKRYERVAKLQRNLQWLEKNYSVFGLPKEKVIRLKLKIKKEKVVAKEPTLLDSSSIKETKNKKTSRDDRETRK